MIKVRIVLARAQKDKTALMQDSFSQVATYITIKLQCSQTVETG